MKDMLKKFNTTETWIDVETLANLKGVSKRAIRLSFNSKNSNYETKIENGKGGKLYKIRLSSIEEELQIKYIHEYYDTLATTNNIVELHEFKPKAEAPAKKPIDATMFRKAYDELKAEFADELDSVKEYLGGWTSTLVINRSK